jgi:hypothetical protein
VIKTSARATFLKSFSSRRESLFPGGEEEKRDFENFFQNTAKINSSLSLSLSSERETKTKAKKSDSFVPDVVVAVDCDGEEDAMPPRRRMVDPYFSCFFL